MHILFVRIGRLGDIVMILPALMEMKRLYPTAKFSCITSPDGLRLLKTLNIDMEILVYRNTLLNRIFDTITIKKFIKQNHFDHIFCFEAKKRTVSWLPSQAKIIQNTNTLTHYAQRCLQVVNPSLENPSKTGYFPFEHTPPDFPQEFGIKPDTILIGIHPSYSGYQKNNRGEEPLHRLWPPHYFAELIKKISQHAKTQNLNIKIIMNLLPSEYALGQLIEKECEGNLIVYKPTPNLKNYLAYLQRLQLFITPNTGVMHLAAALNKPMIALFSREHPEDCGPFMPADRCMVLRAENYPSQHLGLANIPVEAVFEACFSLLI